MKTQRGFTLVEMMIVVAIIAVLSALMIGISGQTYGANSKAFADQVNSTVSLARLRAVSMRKYHMVEFFNAPLPTTCRGPCIVVWQWSQYGLGTPDPANCNPPASHCWQLVSTTLVPSGVNVWNAQTPLDTALGATPSQDTSLDFQLVFKPDGSATTGATIFINDARNDAQSKYRVLVYPVTGSSYARQNW